MGLFDQFPYTNFHELNLDWILKALKELEHTIDQFVAINALKYADPIQWDITSQYEKNTIVIDPQTGTAYISVQPVPIGVALTNPDYWTVVFDLGSFVVRAAKNFANTYEAETTLTATVSTPAGGWLVWGDTLYKANVNITAGDSYVVGGNITHFTIEDVIGHLEDLTTNNKSNLVAAINDEVQARVDAINDEVQARQDADTTLQDALDGEIQARQDADTTLQDALDGEIQTRQDADAAINDIIGDLNDLNTTNKSDIVAAINEVITTGGAFYNIKANHVEGASYADEINAAFNTYDFIIFPEGLYEIDEPLKITRNVTVLLHGNAEIKAIAAMPYLIGINPDNLRPLPEPSYTVQGGNAFLKTVINGGYFNCNNLANIGFIVNSFYHSSFSDMVFVSFTDIGVVTAYNGGYGGAHSGFDNITLNGAAANYGFQLNSNDEYVNDCVAVNCKVGYGLYAGDIRLQNCTTWLGFGGESLYDGSIGYDTRRNGTSAIIDNCNVDTMQTGFSIKDLVTITITNTFCAFNSGVITPTDHDPVTIFDITWSNSMLSGVTINNVIDPYNFNHYVIKSSASGTFNPYVEINNIDFLFDPATYVIDYPDNLIPTLFKNYAQNIDCKLVRMGSQFVLYFKIISPITLAANSEIAGGLVSYTLFSSETQVLPAMLYDSNNAIIPTTTATLQTSGRHLRLRNNSAAPVTIAKGDYIGFYDIKQ